VPSTSFRKKRKEGITHRNNNLAGRKGDAFYLSALFKSIFYFHRRKIGSLFSQSVLKQDQSLFTERGRRGHDRMLFGFTTTYVISAYHH
jgi:hypothetical protein